MFSDEEDINPMVSKFDDDVDSDDYGGGDAGCDKEKHNDKLAKDFSDRLVTDDGLHQDYDQLWSSLKPG